VTLRLAEATDYLVQTACQPPYKKKTEAASGESSGFQQGERSGEKPLRAPACRGGDGRRGHGRRTPCVGGLRRAPGNSALPHNLL